MDFWGKPTQWRRKKRVTIRQIRGPARKRKRRRVTNRNARTGGFMGMELKFKDVNLNASVLATTADGSGMEKDPSATVVLNSLQQGDGESQRDGRRVTMRSVFVSGMVQIPAQADQTVPEAPPHVCIYLVLDKQTNGATISSEDVFVNPSGTALGGTSLMRNLQFTSRFTILDKVSFNVPIGQVSGDSTNFDMTGGLRKFKLSANLNNLRVTFSGTEDTVANITDNSLHLLASVTSGTTGAILTYNSRLRFMG